MAAVRAAALSAAETGPPLLGVQPHVDDLGEVDRDVGAVGVDLVPAVRAVAAQGVAQGAVGGLPHAESDRLAPGEADDDLARSLAERLHQGTGSTSSVRTPPVDRG